MRAFIEPFCPCIPHLHGNPPSSLASAQSCRKGKGPYAQNTAAAVSDCANKRVRRPESFHKRLQQICWRLTGRLAPPDTGLGGPKPRSQTTPASCSNSPTRGGIRKYGKVRRD